jgi:polyphosphate kinase
VRGLCCLKPGVPGLSDNIRVIAITGRYLEHSRILYFHNAPVDQRTFIGSADMMRRNLYNRVEIIAPVIDFRNQTRLMRIMETDLRNTDGAWQMTPDAEYVPVEPKPGEPPFKSQNAFMVDSFGLDNTL